MTMATLLVATTRTSTTTVTTTASASATATATATAITAVIRKSGTTSNMIIANAQRFKFGSSSLVVRRYEQTFSRLYSGKRQGTTTTNPLLQHNCSSTRRNPLNNDRNSKGNRFQTSKSNNSTTTTAATTRRTAATTTTSKSKRKFKSTSATAAMSGEGAAATASSTTISRAAEGYSFQTFLANLNRILNKPRTIPIPRWVSPTHSTTTLSEIFGHSSFILVAISYAVDDFVHLRLLAIAGSSAMLVFTYFHPHGRVLWLPFKWNVLFIAINTYRVMKVHIDRFFAEQLSPLLLHIHDHHFYVMDKVDFARLVRLGTIEQFKQGDVVVAQGQDNRYVRLVLKGELHVERDGQTTYMLNEGNFISESGLHAGLLLRGKINSCCSVIANTDDVTTVRWDRTELMHLLEVDRNFRNSIKAVMSWDIVSKLKSQRILLASGKVNNAEEWSQKRREQTVHRYKAILGNLLAHPQYLNKRKDELHKYRDIHHINDNEHEQILNELGWTLDEFDKGEKDGQIDEDLSETDLTGWKWYAQELKLRILG